MIGSIGCSVLQAICDNSRNAGNRVRDINMARVTHPGINQAGRERVKCRCGKIGDNDVCLMLRVRGTDSSFYCGECEMCEKGKISDGELMRCLRLME